MKTFELSNKQYKDGKRFFKLIMAEIYKDDCIVDGVGTEYNDNGITWLKDPVEKALPSIVGTSLTCEFLDDERTEIGGHGDTGEVQDGIPLMTNATVIGNFSKGYIETMTIDDVDRTFLIGEGYIDVFRYKPFVDKLEEELADGNTVYGSIEIFKTSDNDSIIYRYGYKDIGRVPEQFVVSGFAFLGIRAADLSAKLLELNAKRKNEESEDFKMDEKDIAKIVSAVSEVCSKNNDYEATIASKETEISELNSCVEKKDSEISELKVSVETLEKALEDLKKEQETYWEQREILEKEIAQYKVEKRLTEFNAAIADFTSDEIAYAQTEVDAFKADPMVSEINSITDKILAGIGKKSKEESKINEINSKKSTISDTDIFGDVYATTPSVSDEDVSIY